MSDDRFGIKPRFQISRDWASDNLDGRDESRFSDLAVTAPELSDRLKLRFVELWLSLSHLPTERFAEALGTVEIKLSDHKADARGRTLRLRSFYTGSTYWLPDWDGSAAQAELWVESVAELQAANVRSERIHGPTEWDL